MSLVLSIFPGIGLLDMAFEKEGFCVVRGPDLLWGGDIHQFHPPSNVFDGIIGGPPCKRYSGFARLNKHLGRPLAACLISEFERCILEAAPNWFLMENVAAAPEPTVKEYTVISQGVRDDWTGGETVRFRRFSFGSKAAASFEIEQLALHRPDPEPTVTARASVWDRGRQRPRSSVSWANVSESLRCQGLPLDFFHRFEFSKGKSALTCEGAQAMIGNGVPLAMGCAVASAVRRTLESEEVAA